MRVSVASIILLIFFFLKPESANAQIPDGRRMAAAQFKDKHGGEWNIRWNEQLGTPASLIGGRATGYSGDPEVAALTFLKDHQVFLGIDDPDRSLELVKSHLTDRSAQVSFRKLYRGFPVLFSGYLVALRKSGEIYYASGDYYPEIKV